MWIQKFLSDVHHPWKKSFKHLCHIWNIKSENLTFVKHDEVPKDNFYKLVFQAADKGNTELKNTIMHITNEPIPKELTSTILQLELEQICQLPKRKTSIKNKNLRPLHQNRAFRHLELFTVGDILHANGKVKNCPDRRYWLDYNTLQEYIPRNIINILKQSNPNIERAKSPKLLLNNEWKDILKIKSRTITEYINNKSTTEPNLSRISNALGISISDTQRKNIFRELFKLKLDPYTRQFQFRLLNNNIYLNRRLFIFKVIDSPRCSFCQLELETLEHFFLKCTKTRQVWANLECWWKEIIDSNTFTLTDKNIMIGTDEEPHADLLEVLLIDAKIELYHARRTGNPPNIKRIINKFTNRCKTEEITSRKSARMQQHNVKWQPIIKSLYSPKRN